MTNYFNLNLVYDGPRIKLYKFEPPNQEFPVLNLKSNNYKDRTEITTDLKRLGYSWWLPYRSKQPPTHVLLTNYPGISEEYIRHKSAEPSKDIQFITVDRLEGEYFNCQRVFMTVPQIPKVFDINSGSWMVHKQFIYQTSPSSEDNKGTHVIEVNLEDIKKLESAGILDFGLRIKYSDWWSCKLASEVPTKLWFELSSKKTKLVNVDANILRTDLLENHIPLSVDTECDKYTYFLDNQGGYWRYRTLVLMPDKASMLLGINSRVNIYASTSPLPKSEITIPLDVLELGPEDTINLTFSEGHKLDLTLGRLNDPYRGTFCNQTRLRFKEPFVHSSGLCFINDEEDLKKYNIVKLQRNLTAPENKQLQLCYVNNSGLFYLPGTYAFAKDVVKQNQVDKEQYKQLKLDYKLPGGVYQWSIEDLQEYNRLMKSGEYHIDPVLQVGSKIVYTALPERYFASRSFINKSKTREVIIWKKQDWFELVQLLSKDIQQGRFSMGEGETTRMMLIAAAMGLEPTHVFSTYAKLIGLSEMETLSILNKSQSSQDQPDCSL